MTATSEEQRQSADWDIRSSASNYLTLIMAQAVASLGAFATVWVATRLLGAEGYGRVAAVIAATQLVIQVALNWTAHAVTRFGCEEFVKTKKISKSFWTRLMILAPNLLLILLTSDLWLPHLAKWLKIHSAAQPLVLVYIVVNVFWLHIQHTLQGVKLQRVQAILMASERLLSFVVLTVFILSRSLSSLTMILAYITGAVAVSLIGLWQLRSLIFPLLGLDRELFSAILKFSLPLLPGGLAGYLIGNYLDAIFITNYLSVTHLGLYSVAYLIVGTFLQIPTQGSFLLLPLFVSLQNDGRREAIERYLSEVCPLIVLGWSMVCAGAAFLCAYLLPVLFGRQYQDVSILMWPLMAMAAISGPILLGFGAVSNAWLKTHISFYTVVLQGATNVILNILLIPRFGLVGCAWASVLASCISLVAWVYFISRQAPAVGYFAALATLPALVGAICAIWVQNQWLIFIGAVFTFVVVCICRLRSLKAGLRVLQTANINIPGLLPRRSAIV